MGPIVSPAPPAPATPLAVSLLPVLQDNYIFVLARGQEAAVVDPAVAEPVIAWLEERGLELVAVLQTPHHSDHIGGTPALLRRWPAAAVIAAASDRARIPFQTQGVEGGERFTLLGNAVEVLAVPGHTHSHIAFHLPEAGHLFCGDALFAGGCGRLFEGTPDQLHASLQRLAALPPHTRVWCAHEYTEANLRWAAAQEPADPAIAERLEAVRQQRRSGAPTIPSTIGLERATNLMVRAASVEELAQRRRSKDRWRG
ncbi:MAG: hydroxyacylglutathione hydrolase [Synechococcus sp.]|nr:hydroxyacylglutathione hydrolase [Synechococcus sp.]